MAIAIPGSGADDQYSDQLEVVYTPATSGGYALHKEDPTPLQKFGSYAATGNEATTAFSVYMFKIPADHVVVELVFEHGDFVDGGSAFNCNIGTDGDVDCFVVDEGMDAAGIVQLGEGSASLRGPQSSEEWLVVNFEAPGAAMLVGAQLRVWAKMVKFT